MRSDDLTAKPKKDLLDLARKLGIAGRTAMTKEDLSRAIRKASPSPTGGSKGADAGRPASTAKPASAAAKKPAAGKTVRAAKGASPAKGNLPAKQEPIRGRAPESRAPDRAAEKPAPPPQARESAPPPARPEQPKPPSPPPPPPPQRPLPPTESRPPHSGWQAARPPRDMPPPGQRRNIPGQDPAMKLSRVEEIRKSLPGRPQGRPGRPGGGSDPRNMRQGPGGGGRPMQGDRRGGDRFPQKGGPHRGGMDRRPDPRGSLDRREGLEKRNDPHAIERSLQAREHLRRSSDGRRGSGYTRDSERPREARPVLEPPRPAAIPEHLARVVTPPPPPPARQGLEERTGHPLELPETYGTDRVVLLVRDPYWLHVYWEVTPASIQRVRSQIGDLWNGHRWLLRMYAYPQPGTGSGNSHFDIELNAAARNWYTQVPSPDCGYEAAVGILTRDGAFYPFAKSNRVRTPRDTMSGVLDAEWASTDDQWKEIYSLSGGQAAGIASGSSAELGESLQERLKEGWFSGMLGSMGSGSLAAGRPRGFWFQVNTELILYGSTEPNARVNIQGRKIALRPDGTFTLRFQLPDGVQEIPCVATSADGTSERTITPVVRRQTTSSEHETAATKDPEI